VTEYTIDGVLDIIMNSDNGLGLRVVGRCPDCFELMGQSGRCGGKRTVVIIKEEGDSNETVVL